MRRLTFLAAVRKSAGADGIVAAELGIMTCRNTKSATRKQKSEYILLLLTSNKHLLEIFLGFLKTRSCPLRLLILCTSSDETHQATQRKYTNSLPTPSYSAFSISNLYCANTSVWLPVAVILVKNLVV